MGQQLGAITAVFQAKMQQGPVSRRYVDMLRGALWSPDREKGMVGYLVTTSSFTRPAIRSAERDQPEVRLINGHAIATMMLESRVGMIQTGTGRRTRVLLDLSFFSRLRDIVVESMGSTGTIRISIDEYGMPVRGM
jgi:restriction endonuclease Mrr